MGSVGLNRSLLLKGTGFIYNELLSIAMMPSGIPTGSCGDEKLL